MSRPRFQRSSGVVMPLFSLPSPYGIGTMGRQAYQFVDWLAESGQRYWQMLPLGHTSSTGNSPYQTYSSVAGNPNLIDWDYLVEMELLTKDFANKPYISCFDDFQTNQEYEAERLLQLDFIPQSSKCREYMLDSEYKTVKYGKLKEIRMSILYEAYLNFKEKEKLQKEMQIFISNSQDWLPDYAMFMALKRYFHSGPIYSWDYQVIKRVPDVMELYRNKLEDEINFFCFIQYLFFDQWKHLKSYANMKGILLVGDLPFYPSPDGADVWANQSLFKVDEICRPSAIAGVPPDYYSSTGQLWGNPTYNWEEHEKDGYQWWMWRLRHTNELFDVIRVDHFWAFQDYWEVPAGESTAINGRWMPGPRMKFFEVLKHELGDLPIIAEDLGDIDESVHELLRQTGYPGMRSIIWGLRKYESNIHLPINYGENIIAYTSTHDSETFCQTMNDVLSDEDREFAMDYLNLRPDETLGFSAIRTSMASRASVTMLMAPDILSLGEEGRINVPGTVSENNWAWRTKPDAFTKELAEKLRKLTATYKRLC